MANTFREKSSFQIGFPIKIAVIYAVLGVTWILFSDQLLVRVAAPSGYLMQISMAKGWLFVIYTAVVLYLLLSREFKEVQKSQEALQLSERRFRAMFEMASVGMAQVNPSTGRWQHLNQRFADITGYTIQELEGRRFSEITHPEDREQDWQAYQAMVRGETPVYRSEKRYIRKDGTSVWVNVSVNMVYDESGQPLHSLGVVEDITARVLAEEGLRQSEQRFRQMAETVKEVFWLATPDYQSMLYISPAFEQIWGHPCAALYKNPMLWLDAVYPDDISVVLRSFEELSQDRPFDIEYRITRPDGTIRWINDHGYQGKDENGRVTYVTGVASDITERKVAELALRESEQRVRVKLDHILSPEGDLQNLELADIIDVPVIHSLLEDFYELAHFPSAIADIKGKVLTGVGWQDICAKFHRKHPEACLHCTESDTQLTQGVPPGEVKLYKCKNNMWDIATPLIVGGQHLGNIFSGQFFFDDEPLDYELFRSQARKYGFNEPEYLAALERVPRLSKEVVDKGMAFLVKLANMFSLLSYSNIKLARSLTERGALTDSLRESQERLNLALAASHMGVWEWNLQTDAILWSPECFEIAGVELISDFSLYLDTFMDIVHPEDLACVMNTIRNAIAEKKTYAQDFRIIQPNGEVRWVANFARAEYDENDEPLRMVGSVRDITEHKQTAEALSQSESKYRSLVETSFDWIWEVDAQGRFTYAAPKVFDILGYKPEEILGRTPFDFMPEPEAARIKANFKEAAATRRPFAAVENVNLHRDGRLVVMETSGVPFFGPDGELAGYRGTDRDITQRKRAEEAMEAETIRRRILVEQSRDGIVIIDENGKVFEANQQFARMLGYSAEEVTDLHVWDWDARWSREELEEIISVVGVEGDHFETRHRRQDGTVFDVEISSNAAVLGGQKLTFCVCRDISWRKAAEASLRQSETKFRELFENMSSAVAIYRAVGEGEDFAFLEVNRALERIDQVNRKDMLGGKVSEIFPGVKDFGLFEVLRRVWRTGIPEALRRSWYQDKRIEGWRENYVFRLPGGEVVAVYDDVTERVRSEEALSQYNHELQKTAQELEQSRNMLQLILESIPVRVFWKDSELRYLGCNTAFARDAGFSYPEQLLGMDDLAMGWREQAEHYRADDHKVIESGRAIMNMIEPQTTPTGGTIWLNTSKVPLQMPDGEVVGVLGVYEDITERKRAEEALRQSEKRFRHISSTISDISYSCTAAPDGSFCIEWMVGAAERITGYSVAEIKAQRCWRFLVIEEDLPLFQKHVTGLAADSSSACELRLRHKNGGIVWVASYAECVKEPGPSGRFYLYGGIVDINKHKQAEKQLRALATRMAEVEEEERQALARELHDQVCQNLAILGLTMESLKMRARREPLDRLLSRIGEIATLVEQTGEVTRELMEGLRPTVLDHYGLLEGLRRWAQQFSQRTGINVDVLGEEAEPRLAGAAELALFRIAQEALNNVAKHAQASRVVLSEVVHRDTVRLDIVDDGIGFDPDQARPPEGRHQWGLMTMSERAMAVGGHCRIESQPGAGTRVMVEVSR